MKKKIENMVTPSVDELSRVDETKGESYNRYTLAIAVAKSARLATDEMKNMEPSARPATNPIRIGVDRIIGNDYKIDATSVKKDDEKLRSGN